MDIYGKVFKYYNDSNNPLFKFEVYSPERKKYYELIQEALNNGESQVILSSPIMLKVIYETLFNNGIVLSIGLSDYTDKEVSQEVPKLLEKMRNNNLEFSNLSNVLNWADNEGSIDIESIDLYIKNERFKVQANGIFYSISSEEVDNLEYIFNTIIKPTIESVVK